MDRPLAPPVLAPLPPAPPLHVPPRAGATAALLRRILRRGCAPARLRDMPRERLEDMGIAPRSEANRRSSGEAGPIPRADLW